VHRAAETRHLDRGDGCCRHYDDGSMLCTVYENRPEICRVDLQYEQHYRHQMTWEIFSDLNVAACEFIRLTDHEEPRSAAQT